MKKLIFLAMLTALPAFGQRSLSVSTNGMPGPLGSWGIQTAPTNLVWTGIHENRANVTNTAAGSHRFAGGFTVTSVATQAFARVTGWLELAGQLTNFSGIYVASNLTAALAAPPPAGKVGLVASNNTWWLVTSAGVWTDLAAVGAGGGTGISTNAGSGTNNFFVAPTSVDPTNNGLSTLANTRITGALIIPPVTNANPWVLSAVTNTFTRNPSLTNGAITFSGTPLEGTILYHEYVNLSNTNQPLTFPSSLQKTAHGLTAITTHSALSNSLTTFRWEFVSGAWQVDITEPPAYLLTLGPTVTIGEVLKVHAVLPRIIVTNGVDVAGAGGALIRFQTNTVIVASATNLNTLYNAADLLVLATNNGATGSVDQHWSIAAGITRDTELFGYLVASNYATFANIGGSNFIQSIGGTVSVGALVVTNTLTMNGGEVRRILTNAYTGLLVFLDLATNTMQYLTVTNDFTLVPTNMAPGLKGGLTLYNITGTSVTITLPAVQIYGSGISNVVAAGKRMEIAYKSQDASITNVAMAFAQQKN